EEAEVAVAFPRSVCNIGLMPATADNECESAPQGIVAGAGEGPLCSEELHQARTRAFRASEFVREVERREQSIRANKALRKQIDAALQNLRKAEVARESEARFI